MKVAINPGRERVARGDAVLTAVAGDYHDRGFETPLTLKAVVRGKALYSTTKSRYAVEPGTVAVLPPGRKYDLDIQREWRSETLALFFSPGLAHRVLHDATRSDEAHLDPIDTDRDLPIECYDSLYPVHAALARRLETLHRQIKCEAGWHSGAVEEIFVAIAGDVAALQLGAREVIARLAPRRTATRIELHRRLCLARDYLHSCYDEPLTLDDAASVACLSPFHFLRTFRSAFGVTPMQYLRDRRLEVARQRVLESEQPITQICLDVGFESPSSFSTLFTKQFGGSPRALRAAARNRSRKN